MSGDLASILKRAENITIEGLTHDNKRILKESKNIYKVIGGFYAKDKKVQKAGNLKLSKRKNMKKNKKRTLKKKPKSKMKKSKKNMKRHNGKKK